jgi:nucleotide-binding universal stress UspA family protein
MQSPFFSKIVWAIDTMEPGDFQKNARFILGSLVRKTSANVYPVHVLNFPYASSGEAETYEEAYLALAEKRLKKLPEEADLPQIQTGKVLVNRTGSLRHAVELVLEYALQKEADAIVVSTHSRGTVSRLFMGSFAENILLQSEIPVITVNPQTTIRESVSKVLFPTTFSKQFRTGFQKTVQLCAILNVGLTLFYKEPFIPMVETFPEFNKVLEQEARKRREEADRWRDWAKQYNVPIEIRMDTNPGNVAEEIEAFASKNNFDLIAMVSQTLDSDIPRVGSICRKVVRSAHCPVWTIKTDDYDEEDMD